MNERLSLLNIWQSNLLLKEDEMPVHTDDRLLWIIVGSGLLIAANAIPYYLNYIRTVTEVQHDGSPSKGPCEDAEDALKLSTLKKLVAGPSYKLRASAVKIIAERSTRDVTRKLLLQDLASKNTVRRDQALHALWFLLSDSSLKTSPEIPQHFTSDTSTFPAIIECLANLLPLHENGPPVRADNPTASSPLLPDNRPPPETLALLILRKLLTDENATSALSSGLISTWLKHYPFPCALPANGSRRQDVVKLFKTWGQDDPLMASIMTTIRHNPEGLKQLRRHGLTGSSYREAEVDLGGGGNGIDDVFMANAEDTAGMRRRRPPPPPSGSPRPARPGSSWAPRRPPDPSSNQAERAVRQRRREAAVYSEGNAPLTQDNIFQRQPSNLGLAGAPATNPEEDETVLASMAAYFNAREEEESAVAMEEASDRNSRRASSSSSLPDLDSPSTFWQWLTTMSSGRARDRQRPPRAELENGHDHNH